MKFETEKILVASTAHVLEKDISSMYEILDMWMIHDYDYGISVRLDDNSISKFSGEIFSEGIKMMVLFAISIGCNYLKLDSDGPIYKEFPRYDW